jgi:hypothetical protein
LAGIQLGNQGVYGDDVRTLCQADKHFPKAVNPWMIDQVAANGAKVIVAVKESING